MKRSGAKLGGRTRTVKRRRFTPKRKAPLRTRVNKILTFIKRNKPETKKAVFRVNSNQFKGGECVTWNLMYEMMNHGVGETQFVGKSFNLKGISVKIWARNESYAGGTTGFSAGDQKHIFSIIGHKEYVTLSSLGINNINATEFGTFKTYTPHYDADKVKIYKQTTIHHKGTAAGIPPLAGPPFGADINGGLPRSFVRSMYIPMNRKITFERYNTDFKISGLNLYFLAQSDFMGYIYNGTGEYYCRYDFDIALYYTDD